MEAGDRRAMAQDCARSCSGRIGSPRRGGSPRLWPAVEVAGRFWHRGRTAGYAIGEGRTSPWLKANAGIRERPYPRLGSKPVSAPRTRSVRGMVRSSARIFTGGARDSSPLPSARKCGQGKPLLSQMCAGQSSVRGNLMCGQDVRGNSHKLRLFFRLVDQRCSTCSGGS